MGEEIETGSRREIEAQISALFVLVEATLVSQMTALPPPERARVQDALLELAARTGGRSKAILENSIARVFQSLSRT
jgi:protein subunit release factor A